MRFKRILVPVALAVAVSVRSQDDTAQIITRDPREGTVAVNEWTTVAVVNPHDGFGRSYVSPNIPRGARPGAYTTQQACELYEHTWQEYEDGSFLCEASAADDYTSKTNCEEADYFWVNGACEEENPDYCEPNCYGEFTMMLGLTGFPELTLINNNWAIQAKGYDYAGKEIRVRTRKYDHANAEPSMLDQEGNFTGAEIHALCHDPDGDWDNDPRGGPYGTRPGFLDFGNCAELPADWPPETQWPKHQKIKYWERSGGEPDTTYYVEGPFLIQVRVENGCYLEGVIRIHYHGYTDVVGGGDRREVIEYSEVVVRGAGPAPND